MGMKYNPLTGQMNVLPSASDIATTLRAPGILHAYLGPSIYQHGHGATITGGSNNGAGAWVGGTCTQLTTTARSDMNWLSVLSEGRIDTLCWPDANDPYYLAGASYPANVGGAGRAWKGANCGLSGDYLSSAHNLNPPNPPTPGMRARVGDVPPNANVVALGSPTNSIHNAAAFSDLTGFLDDITYMIDYFLAKGKAVVVDGCENRSSAGTKANGFWPASNYGSGEWTRSMCFEYNVQVAEIVRRRRAAGHRVYFFDVNRAWVDYTTTLGDPKTGLNSDFVHREVMGGYVVGKYRWKCYQEWFSGMLGTRPIFIMPDSYYNSTYCPHGFLGDSTTKSNPFHLNTGGTTFGTGTVPQYHTIARKDGTTCTVASSVVTAAERDGWKPGNLHHLDITFPSAASTDYETIYMYPGKTSFSHGLAAGTWIRGFMWVNIPTAYAGWKRMTLNMAETGTYAFSCEGMQQYFRGSDYSLFPNEPWCGLIQTPAFQVQSGSTLNFRAWLGGGGSAGTAAIEIGPMAVVPIDDPNTLWYG